MRVAVGGTSGKSTVTGMIGWIMTALDRDPTIMNGAVMKNFRAPDAPFASARVGQGGIFVPKWMKATARSRSTAPASRC
jgi:UDP-N-acetylmuramate--alanine ligase